MESNPAVGILGFWMMLQLALTVALLLGGIYALFCLGRAASGLDRMASALEDWVEAQRAVPPPTLPGSNSSEGLSFSQRVNPPVAQPTPPVQAQQFSPQTGLAPAAPSVVNPTSSRPDELAS